MDESFSIAIGKFVKKAPEAADKIVRKVCFDLFQNFVNQTPYDTGRARGGWSVGVNKRKYAPERYAEPGTNADMTLYNIFGEAKSILAEVKSDSVIYIVNNVEYIVPLEYGSSRQRPKGWVRITLRQNQDNIKEAAAGL